MKNQGKALTFDDILLVPAYSNVVPAKANLETWFSRNLKLKIPLISAAMDTVTEAPAAICMAQNGGIGVIHRNMTPDEQANHVQRVKKFESGIITDPITVGPKSTIGNVLDLADRKSITGFPVLEDGKLAGLVTSRDIRFETKLEASINTIMTPRDRLVTVKEGADIDEILALLKKHKIEKILVVNDTFELKGMVTFKDIMRTSNFPDSSHDDHGRLLVAAAIGVGSDTDARVERLIDVGVDALVLDTAHGYSEKVITRLHQIKHSYSDVDVIVGNIATAKAARDLIQAGADGIKVGIGPGSICTTRVVSGVGVPQFTAIREVCSNLTNDEIPVIADGGIRFSGDVAKAIAAGASSIMIGSLLAGTDEAPGVIEMYQGRSYKAYRGMGSLGALQEGSRDRYQQDPTAAVEKLVPEGIEGRVPYKGPMNQVIYQLLGGLRSAMGYLGCHDLNQMRKNCSYVEITTAGIKESHVHDVAVVKEAPNYQLKP